MSLKKRFQKYGITIVEYQDMWFAQKGCCGICGDFYPGVRMGIDHDHDTGDIRGLLCTKCNTGLGKLGDDEEGLYRALDYLNNRN
jgi:hypothetical protein